MAITFYGPAFQRVHLASGLITLLTRSYNPGMQAHRFGLFRFRSPLLSESRLIYFPPGTEMVHFPGLARTRLWIQRAVHEVHSCGFPHSDISGSKPACGSPKLFAACHVLLRLLAPRHPPYALSSLTIKLTAHAACPLAGTHVLPSKFAILQVALIRKLWLAHAHAFAGVCVCHCLIRLSKNLGPAPGGTSTRPDLPRRAENKKPGVERRARPSHRTDLLVARPYFYPVFVTNLTS